MVGKPDGGEATGRYKEDAPEVHEQEKDDDPNDPECYNWE